MNKLEQEKYGKFIKENQKLSYTLNDNQLFAQNQQKMCNNQTDNLFVKSQKIQRNGKVKIVYLIEENKNILDIVKGLDEDDYYKVCSNFIYALNQINENGFLYFRNVVIEPDMIYVEKDTLQVKFIYVPVINENKKNVDIENIAKTLLTQITDKNIYSNLCEVIAESNLTEIQEWLENQKTENENLINPSSIPSPITTEESPVEEETENFIQQESRQEFLVQNNKNTKKTIVISSILAITLLIILGIVCSMTMLNKRNVEQEEIPAVLTPTLEPTVTLTPTPTPTVTPTPEPTATSTFTPTPKPQKVQETVKTTPVVEQPVQNNYVPAQTQQNVAPPTQPPNTQEASSVQEQPEENNYDELDDFIIVE